MATGQIQPRELVAAEESFSVESMLCTECGRSFATHSGLKKHLKTHSGEYELRCDICEKVFPEKRQLKAHMMRHGAPKLRCGTCERQFTRPDSVKRHAHTCGGPQGGQEGKDTYACTVCKKVFNRKDEMKDHIQALHSFMFQYDCGQCSKRYMWRSSLSKHMRTKHSG